MSAPVRLRLIPYNARLVDARKARGLTQRQLAQLTGITNARLCSIETLRTVPRCEEIDELCSALDLTEDYLFPPSLMEALREGAFDHRSATLEEEHIVRLTERRRAGLLSSGIADEPLKALERSIDLKSGVSKALKVLTPQQRDVLELRFGLKDGGGHTGEEVGKEYHVTRNRIYQIEAKALRKLRMSRQLRDLD